MIGTKFNYYDLSAITEVEDIAVDNDTAPVVLACGATAKGTEDLIEVSGNDYQAMYGAPDFSKYGQASIQNQRIISAGAKLLFQRLVADDATLANLILVAKVYQTSYPRVNANGDALYYDSEMNETTEATSEGGTPNTAIVDEMCHVFYKAEAAANVKTIDAVVTAAASSLNAEGVEEVVETKDDGEEVRATVYTYPIVVLTDNGRGTSNKRLLITPETSLSKNLKFMYYSLRVIEDGNYTDTVRFSAIPNKAYGKSCIDLNTAAGNDLKQGKAKMIDDNMEAFLQKVCELSGVEYDTFVMEDVLFGQTRKGAGITGIDVDSVNGLQLDIPTGIGLVNGTNGSFTDAPAKNAADIVNIKALEFFNGSTTADIWNLDLYQIDACFDVNYPLSVKKTICTLADYRKDFTYFRDYGLDIYTLDEATAFKAQLPTSTYVTDFCQAYDVKDPYSYKQITVTITYSISAMIISHLAQRRQCPFAGERYSAIVADICDKNTLRFSPKILPDVNEKDLMEDERINFASFFKDKFIIESLYTSQADYTQLSFSNNVLALQQVIKALRVKFPAIRYQFITKEEDLEAYEKEVNDCLSLFAGNFAELRYQYISDKEYRSNKIFRAAIYFRFNDFVQGELIDAYMLPTEV